MYPIVLLARFTKDLDVSPRYGIDKENYRGLCFLHREFNSLGERAGVYYPRGGREPLYFNERHYKMYAFREDQYEIFKGL